MNTYLVILATILVITQVIRVFQNAKQQSPPSENNLNYEVVDGEESTKKED